VHGAARDDAAARRLHVLGERAGDGREVDHAGGGRVQAGDARDVRLDLAQLRPGEPAQAGHPVGGAAALELVEAGELLLVEGDDELAVAAGGDPADVAVLVQPAGAVDAQAGLERAGLVVDARVDDAAVVARLVEADDVLALEHAEGAAGMAPEQLAGDGQADDARADDDEVASLGRRGARHAAARAGLVCQVIHKEPESEAAIHAALAGPP
jgi:hypothetical protein